MIATLVEGLVGELQRKTWAIPRKTKESRKQNIIPSSGAVLDSGSIAQTWPTSDDVISSSPVKNEDQHVVRGGVSILENTMHVLKSTTQQAWRKHKGHDSLASKEVDDDVFYDSRSTISIQRLSLHSELEDEVSALRKQLEQEQELHAAMEKALLHDPGVLPSIVPSHLPAIEQKLLLDIGILEAEVLKLEMEMTALQWQLVHESNKHEAVELHSSAPSSQQIIQQSFPVPGLFSSSPNNQTPLQSGDLTPSTPVTLKELLHVPGLGAEEYPKPTSPPRQSFWSRWNGQDLLCRSTRPSLRKERRSLSPIQTRAPVTPKGNQPLLKDEKQSHSRDLFTTATQVQKTHFSSLPLSPKGIRCPPSPASSEQVHLSGWPEFLQSAKSLSFQNVLPDDDNNCTSSGRQSVSVNFTNVEQILSSHSSPEFEREEDFPSRSEPPKSADEDLGEFQWLEEQQNANKLSEEMVRCIARIYCELSDSNNGRMSLGGNQSPTSHLGNLTASLSSVSESSLFSFTRSPLQSLHSKENIMATDATSDPYKSRGKLSWADFGPYNQVIEVRWLSVGKEQLEYAAHALGRFRLLVEQLEHVNPENMSHEEKLAFWININNALVMHAFLAYGIPRSDLKFFNLMQKAAYCVGGHWFTAALIECSLLKGKAMAHRPQFGLMMALQKTRLKEELIKYGIEHVEPLVNFALCCGAHSSPMVRVYTAERVHEELGFALHGYARAAVGISVKGKLLIPKLLYSYAHETVEDRVLLDWVCNFLPTAQVALIFECIQQRRHHLLQSNNFAVLPFDFSFRYLFPSNICN